MGCVERGLIKKVYGSQGCCDKIPPYTDFFYRMCKKSMEVLYEMWIYPKMGSSKENDNTVFRNFQGCWREKNESPKSTVRCLGSRCGENISHQHNRIAFTRQRQKREVKTKTVAPVSWNTLATWCPHGGMVSFRLSLGLAKNTIGLLCHHWWDRPP